MPASLRKKIVKRAAAPKRPSAGRKPSNAADAAATGKGWRLRLYVAGQTPKSLAAFSNLQKLCEKHMPGMYDIEVIDLMVNPQLAAGDQIVAVPTLVRRLPEPLKRIIGTLTDEQKFLVGMDIRPT